MPLLAIIYVAVVALAAADSLVTNLKKPEPAWFSALNLISNLILLVFFVGYWAGGIVAGMGLFAPFLFVFSVGWEIWTARRNWDEFLASLPSADRPFAKRVITGAEVITAFIGYWFGGIAVLRALGAR